MSINRLLSVAILIIAFFVATLGAYVALTKLMVVQELAAASSRLGVIRAIGEIERNLNVERGLTVLDLQTLAPDDQKGLADFAKARKKTDDAMAAAMARVAAVEGLLDDGPQLSSTMAQAVKKFEDFRKFGTDMIKLPVDRRGDAGPAGMKRVNATNDVLANLLREQVRRMASTGKAYRYVSLADQVWLLRDMAGRKASTLLSLLTLRKPVSADGRKQVDNLDGKVELIWSELTPLHDVASTPASIKAALEAVKSKYFEGLGEIEKKVVAAFDTGDFPFDGPTWRGLYGPVWTPVLALRDAFYDEAASEIGEARVAAVWSASLAGGILVIALAVAGGVLFVVQQRVTGPIGAMTRAMRLIAEGELATQIPSTGRTDEIGEMAKAVTVFRDTAIAKRERDREIEGERRSSEEERRATEAKAIERERALATHSLGVGLAELAAKNLTFRMRNDVPEVYRRLQADFNTAMQQLEEAMTGIAENVHLIEAGSQQITGAADDLAERTKQQASSLKEAAAALEEVTVTVDKTADGARHASATVGTAKARAEKGSDVVRRAIEAMGGIEKSSKQVGQIIGVIDEIAFQTNLLALNAGVEAARAGEAGRGFAVVAYEVRALAQRSAEAAKEIKNLIAASTAQVNEGVGLVADSGRALEQIVVEIKVASRVMGEIAAGATHQATALKDVNAAVNQMNQETQHNAAIVAETTAASHTLLQQASDLIGAVSRFKVTVGIERAGAAAGAPPRFTRLPQRRRRTTAASE